MLKKVIIVSLSSIVIWYTLSGCGKWDLEEVIFTGVETGQAIETSLTGAILKGKISELQANVVIDHYGHCWSNTNNTPTIEDETTDFGGLNTKFSFESTLSSLEPQSIYFYRAYAIVNDQVFYGNIQFFNTSFLGLLTDQKVDIKENEAIVFGSISGVNTLNLILSHGHCWSNDDPSPTIAQHAFNDLGPQEQDAIFSSELPELMKGTTYFVRSYALLEKDTLYGEAISFTFSQPWERRAAPGFEGLTTKSSATFSIENKGFAILHGFTQSRKFDVWVYDSDADSWELRFPLTMSGVDPWAVTRAIGFSVEKRGYFGIGNLGNSEQYERLWQYLPSVDQWIEKSVFDGFDPINGLATVVNGKAYVIEKAVLGLPNLWEYAPLSNHWEEIGEPPSLIHNPNTAFSIDDKAYFGPDELQNTFYSYHVSTQKWERLAQFPGSKRSNAISFAIGNKGYIGLGQSTTGEYLADFWEYDSANNSWRRIVDFFGGPTRQASVFNIEGRAFVIQSINNQLWEFIPN